MIVNKALDKIVPERHHINLQYYENKGISFEKMDSWLRPQFLISATDIISGTRVQFND